jgi:hypothetical protein
MMDVTSLLDARDMVQGYAVLATGYTQKAFRSVA